MEYNCNIRKAKPSENSILTQISFDSKRYWNYPEEYFDIWKDELTITKKYIKNNTVFVAEIEQKIIGYYSIVSVTEDFWVGEIFVSKGFWLEHIFIAPNYIRQGVGTKLFQHALEHCKKIKVEKLKIFSDPNSKGFYDQMGAKYIGEAKSSIPQRDVCVYEIETVK